MTDQVKIKPLTLPQIDAGIEKLRARIKEVEALAATEKPGEQATENAEQAIQVSVLDIFGAESIEYRKYGNYDIWESDHLPGRMPLQQTRFLARKAGAENAKLMLEGLIARLEERKKYLATDGARQTLTAFENVKLHARIDGAAAALYRDGHYKNAVFEAAIALQNAVQEKAQEHALDGTALMEKVFSANAPVLAFTACVTKDEQNEQRGWMFLYSGAIQALRNPRGHSLDPDTPETALECLVFLSFLAKSLERAALKKP